jgi:single-stranded DNA-binding protein
MATTETWRDRATGGVRRTEWHRVVIFSERSPRWRAMRRRLRFVEASCRC